MDNKLIRFLKTINLEEDKHSAFLGATIENVVVNKEEETWTIYIKIPSIIDVTLFEEICKKSEELKVVKKVYFLFKHDNNDKLQEYTNYIFEKYQEKCPMLNSIKKEDIIVEETNIKIEVANITELEKINSIKNKMKEFLNNMGFLNITITGEINDSKKEEAKELLKQKEITEEDIKKLIPKQETKENKEENNRPQKFKFQKLKAQEIELKNIITDMGDVSVTVFVFGSEIKTTASGLNIVTYKISDYTDSLYAKMFINDAAELKKITSEIKEGSWYRMRGYIKSDTFLGDFVLTIKEFEPFDRETVKRQDTAEVKRVELHCHTTMSQMDGLIAPDKLLKKATAFGHRAVGITDKNGIQCFPKVYKKKGDLQVLFGVELYAVNDEILIINKDSDMTLDTEYVVFDTETTGFNAGSGDQMIEIGAVKIKNGVITDRFDELINPGRPLRAEITNITNITDEMLKDKDTEENVTKRFKEWIGNLPMVAQNARFDISFMESAYSKYNLGTFDNVVIDTMEISKAQNPDATKHNLSVLTKRYNIEFDEAGHHRADYDAEATALVFHKMLTTLDNSYKTISDLKKLVDSSIAYKTNRPYHITVYAKNNTGLKNMFKIISLATTKYFYRTPRTPKSLLTSHREGLIIGSGCVNGEIFESAKRNSEEELINLMEFYDFIEVNPPSIMDYLIESGEVSSKNDIYNIINKIISAANKAEKMVVATGDVHTLDPEDNIYREILITQKQPGGGFHPLYRSNIKTIPNAYFMTTDEMISEFEFLGKEKAYEIVVTNSNKVADMFETVEIVKPGLNPPKMENSVQIIKDTVYGNATKTYGENLPEIIATRLDKELTGIINGGYDVIYLIAQRLVEDSNAHGYIVGSRGSVGSSLVATFCGITEVNPLPPHYVCPNCKKSLFENDEGKPFNLKYGSGFDMPERTCECGTLMKRQGQDIPFETFLGFNADKTPDIDLNLASEYQAFSHDYTKVLFGEDHVYRAGTVSTIAEKTAFGFVKIYAEIKKITMRKPEMERLAKGITGIKRTSGQHPGGIIVIPDYKDVFDFTPYQYPAENTEAAWYTTHFEFHDIEENVLKLDILGHDDPTVLKYLSDDVGVNIDDIPLDDRGVLSLFNSPDALGVTAEDINCTTGTLGVPEFGTNFVIKMLEEIRPTKFADLIKISGLSHGTDVWNGNARDLILDGICEFDKVIGCRDDIMLYLIKSGIEKGTAFKMSEFIRKGKTHKEPEQWETFKQIMKEHNVQDWYITSCEKIKYMFPKAHAAAYVTNGFRVAWFKLYHPLNYYRVYLSIRENDFDIDSMVKGHSAIKTTIRELESKGYDKTNKEESILSSLSVANEMMARGYHFENISLTESDATFFKINKEGTGLIPPFTTLDGMGDIAAKKIVEERNDRPFVSVEDLQMRGKVSQTLIDKMRGLGVLDQLPESSQLSLDLFV